MFDEIGDAAHRSLEGGLEFNRNGVSANFNVAFNDGLVGLLSLPATNGGVAT